MNGKLVYFAVFQELHWFFTIKKNVESFVCLQPVNSAHLQGFICRRIFVPELLRGNGIAQNLFVIALQFVKVAIYSDEHQTELASKVWKSLSQRYTVSVVDTATGKLSPYSQSAYTDNPSADKLLIIGPHPPSLIEAHGEFYFIFWNHYTFLTKETNE